MCRFKRFTVEAKRTALAANGMLIVFAFLSALTPQSAWAQGNGRGNRRLPSNSTFHRYQRSRLFFEAKWLLNPAGMPSESELSAVVQQMVDLN